MVRFSKDRTEREDVLVSNVERFLHTDGHLLGSHQHTTSVLSFSARTRFDETILHVSKN